MCILSRQVQFAPAVSKHRHYYLHPIPTFPTAASHLGNEQVAEARKRRGMMGLVSTGFGKDGHRSTDTRVIQEDWQCETVGHRREM